MFSHLIQSARQTLFADREVSRLNRASEWHSQAVITWVAILASVIMSLLNVLQHSAMMLAFTLGSAALLLVSYLAGRPRHRTGLLRAAFTLLFMVIFTIYTVTGGNEGFASLWLILAPYVLIVIIDLRIGFAACVYYLLMLILCFWGPLRPMLQYEYLPMFLTRFPLLYAINFAFALAFAVRMRCYQYNLLRGKEELERLSVIDVSTGLGNRNGYNLYVQKAGNADTEHMSAVYIDVNGLHEINNLHGHEAGDRMLCTIASLCQKHFEDEKLFRIGGDEFLILSARLSRAGLEGRMQAMLHEIAAGGYSVAYGAAFGQSGMSIDELVREADHCMLNNKREYYQKNEHVRRKGR